MRVIVSGVDDEGPHTRSVAFRTTSATDCAASGGIIAALRVSIRRLHTKRDP